VHQTDWLADDGDDDDGDGNWMRTHVGNWQ
jgi:hypothetical protein